MAAALGDSLIEEEMVEVRPDFVQMKVLDKSVTLNQIKKYLTIDAWKHVQSVVTVLQEKGEWCCACWSEALVEVKAFVVTVV